LGPGQARPAEGAQGKSECRAARHEQAWHTLSPVPHVGQIQMRVEKQERNHGVRTVVFREEGS
jgi:hypothetical protein